MTKIACTHSAGETTLKITGRVDTSQSMKVRDYLTKILSDKFTLCRMDLSGLTETDISFIQLVISFRKSVLESERQFSLESVAPSKVFISQAAALGIDMDYFSRQGD